eukprot:7342318-Alexandrium_andersonii.AAC.1
MSLPRQAGSRWASSDAKRACCTERASVQQCDAQLRQTAHTARREHTLRTLRQTQARLPASQPVTARQ